MKHTITIILLFLTSVCSAQTGAWWYGSQETGTAPAGPDTLELTYWNDFILLHIANTGITEDANGVSEWQDRSGNGNHSTQTVMNANKPSTDVDGNVVFDGDDFMDMSVSPDNDFTLFVNYTIGDTLTGYVINSSSGVGADDMYMGLVSREISENEWCVDFFWWETSISNQFNIRSDTVFTDNQSVLVTIAGKESNYVRMYVNGQFHNSDESIDVWSGTSISDKIMGSNIDAVCCWFDSKVSFVGLVNRTMTLAEISTTETELNSFFTIY